MTFQLTIHLVRNFGTVLDYKMKMSEHASGQLQQNMNTPLYSALVEWEMFIHWIMQIQSLATSRLAYCGCLLCGTRKDIERIHKGSARVCRKSKMTSNITEVMKELHWLLVPARIHYKVLVLVFKAVCIGSPHYLTSLMKKKKSTYIYHQIVY